MDPVAVSHCLSFAVAVSRGEDLGHIEPTRDTGPEDQSGVTGGRRAKLEFRKLSQTDTSRSSHILVTGSLTTNNINPDFEMSNRRTAFKYFKGIKQQCAVPKN